MTRCLEHSLDKAVWILGLSHSVVQTCDMSLAKIEALTGRLPWEWTFTSRSCKQDEINYMDPRSVSQRCSSLKCVSRQDSTAHGQASLGREFHLQVMQSSPPVLHVQHDRLPPCARRVTVSWTSQGFWKLPDLQAQQGHFGLASLRRAHASIMAMPPIVLTDLQATNWSWQRHSTHMRFTAYLCH